MHSSSQGNSDSSNGRKGKALSFLRNTHLKFWENRFLKVPFERGSRWGIPWLSESAVVTLRPRRGGRGGARGQPRPDPAAPHADWPGARPSDAAHGWLLVTRAGTGRGAPVLYEKGPKPSTVYRPFPPPIDKPRPREGRWSAQGFTEPRAVLATTSSCHPFFFNCPSTVGTDYWICNIHFKKMTLMCTSNFTSNASILEPVHCCISKQEARELLLHDEGDEPLEHGAKTLALASVIQMVSAPARPLLRKAASSQRE